MRQFRHDLRRGLGSALIAVQESPHPEQYADAVRWACLNNTVYDYQCEAGRGWYLHQAAQLTGQAEAIESDVRARFARCDPDGWLVSYLSDILVVFAVGGSVSAGAALRDRYEGLMKKFARLVARDGWWSSASTLESLALDLVRLDGWDVASTIACDYGDVLALVGPDSSHARWLYFPEWFDSAVRGEFGDEEVTRRLSGLSPGASVYVETAAVVRTRPWRARRDEPELTVELLRSTLERARRGETGQRIRAVSTGLIRKDKTLSDDVAQLGLAETDHGLKAELLWPFRRRPFPLPDDMLADLVDVDDDTLRGVVRTILGQRAAGWKRRHSLELLAQGRQVGEAIDLIMASYEPEDEPVVDAAVRGVPRRGDELHGVIMGLLELLSPEDRPVATSVLDYAFRQTPCSSCRERVVRLMRQKGVLSQAVIRECLWDSDADIRDLATGWTQV